VLPVIVLTGCSRNTQNVKSNTSDDLINIVGTRLSFPKSTFEASKEITGLKGENDALIFVTEIMNNSYESQLANLNISFIEKSGAEIIEQQEYSIDGYTAKKIVTKSPDGLKIRMILFGDSDFCTVITARHYLGDIGSEEEIEFLLDNIHYNANLKVNSLELSPFVIDGEYEGFKHFVRSQNTHFYTRDGKERINMNKDPSLSIMYGELSTGSIADSILKESLFAENPLKYKKMVNGYDAFEGVFEDEKGGREYILWLEENNRYIIVRGTAFVDIENTISDFKKFVYQIKFKEKQ